MAIFNVIAIAIANSDNSQIQTITNSDNSANSDNSIELSMKEQSDQYINAMTKLMNTNKTKENYILVDLNFDANLLTTYIESWSNYNKKLQGNSKLHRPEHN